MVSSNNHSDIDYFERLSAVYPRFWIIICSFLYSVNTGEFYISETVYKIDVLSFD